MCIISLAFKGDDYMSFISNIYELENIKKNYKLNLLKQKEEIKKVISNISKVVVDSDIINSYYGSLVSESLASSNYNVFNISNIDGEIDYINDNSDVISLIYNRNKQIYILGYESSDKKVNAKLKLINNKAIITYKEDLLDGTIIKKKKKFDRGEDGLFEQRYYEEEVIMMYNDIETTKNEKYILIGNNSIVKNIETIVSVGSDIISQEFDSFILDESNYVISNGTFEIKNNGIKKIL